MTDEKKPPVGVAGLKENRQLSDEQIASLLEVQTVLERTAVAWFTAKRLYSRVEMSAEAISSEAYFLGDASRKLKGVLAGLLPIQPPAEMPALVRQIAADVAAMRESQAATARAFNRQCEALLVYPL